MEIFRRVARRELTPEQAADLMMTREATASRTVLFVLCFAAMFIAFALVAR